MGERDETIVGLGPVGLAGAALLVFGTLFRRRLLALTGIAGVVADVKIAALGGFAALNEPRMTELP